MFWALAILKACQADSWGLLLDKLATVPPSSFDEADQHQLCQVYMLLEATGNHHPNRTPPPPPRTRHYPFAN